MELFFYYFWFVEIRTRIPTLSKPDYGLIGQRNHRCAYVGCQQGEKSGRIDLPWDDNGYTDWSTQRWKSKDAVFQLRSIVELKLKDFPLFFIADLSRFTYVKSRRLSMDHAKHVSTNFRAVYAAARRGQVSIIVAGPRNGTKHGAECGHVVLEFNEARGERRRIAEKFILSRELIRHLPREQVN